MVALCGTHRDRVELVDPRPVHSLGELGREIVIVVDRHPDRGVGASRGQTAILEKIHRD